MLLEEAKDILEKNGYRLVEDTDDSDGMSLKDKISTVKRFNNEPEDEPDTLSLEEFVKGMVSAMNKAGWKLKETEDEGEDGTRYYFEYEYKEYTVECNTAVTEEEPGVFNLNTEWPSGMSGNDEFSDPSEVPELFKYELQEWKQEIINEIRSKLRQQYA